jgi:hypothetical protein
MGYWLDVGVGVGVCCVGPRSCGEVRGGVHRRRVNQSHVVTNTSARLTLHPCSNPPISITIIPEYISHHSTTTRNNSRHVFDISNFRATPTYQPTVQYLNSDSHKNRTANRSTHGIASPAFDTNHMTRTIQHLLRNLPSSTRHTLVLCANSGIGSRACSRTYRCLSLQVYSYVFVWRTANYCSLAWFRGYTWLG